MNPDLDIIFKALSDPTRRHILDYLKGGPRKTGDIVSQFPDLSRFGVMKHLDVLREATLVTTQSVGRSRVNYLNAIPIRMIYERWVDGFSGYWSSALGDIKFAAEANEDGGN